MLLAWQMGCASTPDPRPPAPTRAVHAMPGDFVWPVAGYVSSAFGSHRGRHAHRGVDIRTPTGTPIQAAADGRVSFSGSMRGYGRVVFIVHDDGVETRYAHNRRNLVSRGDFVAQGQVIAEVGESGNATAPHVHFEIRFSGVAHDPIAYLPGDSPTCVAAVTACR